VTDFSELSKLAAQRNAPLIIGIAGGSGSGKTTLAKAFANRCGADCCGLIAQDSFYVDQSAKFDRDGGAVNFDHPLSLDFELLAQRLEQLQQREATSIPHYDFSTHRRLAQETPFAFKPLLVVDGTLILNAEQVRPRFDVTVFVDTPESVRFDRRLHRDTTQRGRTADGVRAQFFGQVKPMHDLYVEPSRANAHMTLSGQGDLTLSVQRVAEAVLERLRVQSP
jgi:uridine kinase